MLCKLFIFCVSKLESKVKIGSRHAGLNGLSCVWMDSLSVAILAIYIFKKQVFLNKDQGPKNNIGLFYLQLSFTEHDCILDLDKAAMDLSVSCCFPSAECKPSSSTSCGNRNTS